MSAAAWPTPQDYNEAIQNPRLNFADPDLAAGAPEVSALGLPRPITGNFASVYRVRCPAGDWAVRCFWREYGDMQLRYSAISRHLQASRLPYTVGFDYLPHGIKVQGTWYPALKMEWVEGALLSGYVETHLQDRAALAMLAARWLEMIRALEAAGVAHGDLQHGNVLVVGGKGDPRLRLVDYDGMYVPALAGRGSHELGHQHYQHPNRGAADFGPWVDRFSAWVVYASLLAVSRAPDLWTTLQAGDECLLFRRSDFADPQGSPALGLLGQASDVQVQAAAGVVRSALDLTPRRVPPLGEGAARSTVGSTTRLAPARNLWRALIPSERPAPALAIISGGSSPAWVSERLSAELRPRRLAGSMWPARAGIVAAASAPATFAVLARIAPVPFWPGAVSVVLVMSLGVALVIAGFRRDATVREMRALLLRRRPHARALSGLRRQLDALECDRARQIGGFERFCRGITRQMNELARRERADLDLARALLDAELARIEEEQSRLTREHRRQVEAEMEAMRARHLRDHLRRESVRRLQAEGVSPLLKTRLVLGGMRSAADFTAERMRELDWLNDQARIALAGWRVNAEVNARRSLPRTLPPEILERLAEAHAWHRSTLDRRALSAEDDERCRRESIESYYRRKHLPLEERLARAQSRQEEACRELDAEMARVQAEIAPVVSHLVRVDRELEPYAGLTMPRYVYAAFTSREAL